VTLTPRDPIAILLLALAVANAVVLVSILRRSRVEEPACGRCGYAVRGLESVRCPECGGHLAATGIVTRRMMPVISTWLLAVLGVLLVSALISWPLQLVPDIQDKIDPQVIVVSEATTISGRQGAITIAIDGPADDPGPIAIQVQDGTPPLTLSSPDDPEYAEQHVEHGATRPRGQDHALRRHLGRVGNPGGGDPLLGAATATLDREGRGGMSVPVLALTLVNAVVLAIIVRLGRSRDAACGACGAPLGEIETLACGDCAADLREAGILNRRMTRIVPSLLLAVLAVTILTTFVPAGLMLTWGLQERLNPIVTTTVTRVIWYDAFTDLELEAEFITDPMGRQRCRIVTKRDKQPFGEPFEMGLEGGVPGATADDLLQWIASNGVESDLREGVATMLYDNITARVGGSMGFRGSGPLGSISVSTFNIDTRTRPWVPYIYWSTWATVWVIGVLAIALWARRRRRALAAAAT
jgi:hypothetical protein